MVLEFKKHFLFRFSLCRLLTALFHGSKASMGCGLPSWPYLFDSFSSFLHKGIVKQPGCSWVVHKGTKHMFISGDKSHPLTDQIYHKLNSLHLKLREMGYQPDTKYALHDVELEQKETMLNFHSEKTCHCICASW